VQDLHEASLKRLRHMSRHQEGFENCQGLDNQRSQETVVFLKWTQTGKGTHKGAHCQDNIGAVKIEQRPATVGGKTAHRTHFKTGSGK
jgi:hypothetical protein